MKRQAPQRAFVVAAAFAFLTLLLAPAAFAGDNGPWKPEMGLAERMKIGSSGRIYGWRKGKC